MFRKSLYFVGLLSLIFLIWTGVSYYQFISERDEVIEQHGLKTTASLRDQVDSLLLRIMKEGNDLAEDLGSHSYTMAEVETKIKESALNIAELQGVTACYEPNAFSDEVRLYCPYYNKGTQDYLRVGESYDYSVIGDGTGWYTGVRDNGAKWVEPYFAKAAKDWYIDYGVPFYYMSGPNKGEVRGTITMSFVASGFKKIVQELSLGKTGYGMITSKEGVLLSHPINDYVGIKNIKEIIEEEPNEILASGYQQMIDQGTGSINYYDKHFHDDALFYYDQIPTSGWNMGVMFFKNDLLQGRTELHRRYVKMSLWASLFFFMLIAIYFNKDYLDATEIWQLSFLSSILLIANIILVGYLQHKEIRPESVDHGAPIVDVASLSNFVNQQNVKSDKLKRPKAIPIPTGLYIHRMEFEDSYNLNVGGMVWQKYPLDKIDQLDVGFQFPQLSPFAEASYIEETHREVIEGLEGEQSYVLVGWDVRVTLRLNFDYSNFPFDKRHIEIDITPKQKDENLLFVPDLQSFKYTNPSMMSGLDSKINISGNSILESYFNYHMETYDSDFGYGGSSLFEDVPVLSFNIHLRRVLLNAFVTYLIPIVVCLIMIFILIFACGKTDERQGIIESMAAFFFVLIFSHIDLRKEVVTADLIYMEYFYFITYMMIIISTFNLITYAKNKSSIFDYNENQLFKASYFPIFFVGLLIITLYKFY